MCLWHHSCFTLSPLMTSQSGPSLRLRPHCGPLSLAPSYPEFPPLTSAGWPVGCRTPGPFSPRSSAEQETGSKVFRKRHRHFDNRPSNHRDTKPPSLLKLNCLPLGTEGRNRLACTAELWPSDLPNHPGLLEEQRLNLLLDVNPCFVLRTVLPPTSAYWYNYCSTATWHILSRSNLFFHQNPELVSVTSSLKNVQKCHISEDKIILFVPLFVSFSERSVQL